MVSFYEELAIIAKNQGSTNNYALLIQQYCEKIATLMKALLRFKIGVVINHGVCACDRLECVGIFFLRFQ